MKIREMYGREPILNVLDVACDNQQASVDLNRLLSGAERDEAGLICSVESLELVPIDDDGEPGWKARQAYERREAARKATARERAKRAAWEVLDV